MLCELCGFHNHDRATRCVLCWHPARSLPAGWPEESPPHAISVIVQRDRDGSLRIRNSLGHEIAVLRCDAGDERHWRALDSAEAESLFTVDRTIDRDGLVDSISGDGVDIATLCPAEFRRDTVDVRDSHGNPVARVRFGANNDWAEFELAEGEHVGFLYRSAADAAGSATWNLDLDVLPPQIDWSVLVSIPAMQCVRPLDRMGRRVSS